MHRTVVEPANTYGVETRATSKKEGKRLEVNETYVLMDVWDDMEKQYHK